MYDGRLGRRWNVDPEWKKSFDISPYLILNNSPLLFTDKYGNWAVFVHFMLTKNELTKLGVSTVQAQMIAHMASVFSDHPTGMVMNINKKLINMKKHRERWRVENSDLFYMNYLEKSSIDYSITESSQEPVPESQKWHATRTLEQKINGMSPEQAVANAGQFAWDLIFEASICQKKLENLGFNSEEIEMLGQALHSLQDIFAHKGAVFHDCGKNGHGLLSTAGNEHDLANDINPKNKMDIVDAKLMTKSAIIVYKFLANDINSEFEKSVNNTMISLKYCSVEQIDSLKAQLENYKFKLLDYGDGMYQIHKTQE